MFNSDIKDKIKCLEEKIDNISDKLDSLIDDLIIEELQEDSDDVLVRVPADIYNKIQDFMKEQINVMGIS